MFKMMGEFRDYETLRRKMKMCLAHLSKLGIKNILHGDLLFTEGDIFGVTPPDSEEAHVAFKPNTITYMVPKSSKLADKMLSAKLGIVFHTEYHGDPFNNLDDRRAKFGFDASDLTDSHDVWFADALIHDISDQLSLTIQETQAIEQQIVTVENQYSQLPDEVFNFLITDQLGSQFLQAIKTTVNARLRQYGSERMAAVDTGQEYTGTAFEQDPNAFVELFMSRHLKDRPFSKVQTKIDAGEEFLLNNAQHLSQLYSMYLTLIDIKMEFYTKLISLQSLDDVNPYMSNIDTGELQRAGQEGIVAVDKINYGDDQRAIKLIDREEFSLSNFMSGAPGAPPTSP